MHYITKKKKKNYPFPSSPRQENWVQLRITISSIFIIWVCEYKLKPETTGPIIRSCNKRWQKPVWKTKHQHISQQLVILFEHYRDSAFSTWLMVSAPFQLPFPESSRGSATEERTHQHFQGRIFQDFFFFSSLNQTETKASMQIHRPVWTTFS